MTGRTSHGPIRRLRTVGRTFLALGTGLLLLATLAPIASAQNSNPQTECEGLLFLAKFNANFALVEGVGDGITFSNFVTKPDSDEKIGFTWTSTVTPVDRVVAKAGTVSTVVNYDEGTGPSAVLTTGGAEISHVTFCYDAEQEPDPEADPAIVKTGPASAVTVGSAYSFTLEITNEGDEGSSTGPFTVSDTVPAAAGTVTGVSDDSTDATCSNAGNVVTCSVDELADDGKITVTISVTAPGNPPGVCGPAHTNTASLSTDGDNSSTSNDSSSDDVSFTGCTTTPVVNPTPSVDVEKLVSLNGTDFVDADDTPGATFQLVQADPAQQVWFRVIVTNDSGDGTVLTLNSLTDTVTSPSSDAMAALDLSSCTLPAEGLADGDDVTCTFGPFTAIEGAQHTNRVTVSATGAGQTVGDFDDANYSGTRVAGVVIDRPPPPAPDPVVIDRPPAPAPGPGPDPDPVGEPAPEVDAEELPRTGPADLWLAGLALMLIGGGLLTLARGRAMVAMVATPATWTMRRLP